MTDTTNTKTTTTRKARETDLAADLATANTATAAVWTTTKGLAVGDRVAQAIKGRPANGPQTFQTITAIERPTASTVVLRLGDGAMKFGPATKLFVIKVSAEESPEAREARHQAKAVRDADYDAKVATERATLTVVPAAQRDTEAFRGKEAPAGYAVRWTAPQ